MTFIPAGASGFPVFTDNFAAADLLGVDFKAHRPDAPYRAREYRETGPLHGYSLIPEAYLKSFLSCKRHASTHLVM